MSFLTRKDTADKAHSNPLLGPAVLNSKVPCCAYLLATMLDSVEVDINTRIVTIVDTGLCCVNQSNILSVRCVEIILKLIESSQDKGKGGHVCFFFK